MKKHNDIFAVLLAAFCAGTAVAAPMAPSKTLPATSSAEMPIKKTGQIPRPVYPVMSVEKGEEGKVVLSILVAPGGRVTEVKLIESSGYERLDKAAIHAAWKSKFDTQEWTDFRTIVRFDLDNDMKKTLSKKNSRSHPSRQAQHKRQPNR